MRQLRAGHLPRPVVWRWQLAGLLLALALVAMAVLRVTSVFTGAASAVTRTASPDGSPAGHAGAHGTSSAALAGGPLPQAAAWIAAQVSSDTIIACYPDMCTALQAEGVTASRLMPLPPWRGQPARREPC